MLARWPNDTTISTTIKHKSEMKFDYYQKWLMRGGVCSLSSCTHPFIPRGSSTCSWPQGGTVNNKRRDARGAGWKGSVATGADAPGVRLMVGGWVVSTCLKLFLRRRLTLGVEVHEEDWLLNRVRVTYSIWRVNLWAIWGWRIWAVDNGISSNVFINCNCINLFCTLFIYVVLFIIYLYYI